MGCTFKRHTCMIYLTESVFLLSAVLLTVVTGLDITGYVTSKRHDYGIFNQQLDWFQASKQCTIDGYHGLEVLTKTNGRLSLIMHVLRDNSYNSNTTFWTGLFRPFSYVTSWYDSSTTPCQVYAKSTVPGDITCNHQCVTLTFDNLYDQITLRSEDCNKTYPYICYKNIGPIVYNYLTDHTFTIIPSYADYDVKYNVNVTACEELCTEKVQCVGFTYGQATATCTILYLNTGYGYMTYTVGPTSQTTHGYKTRLKPSYYLNPTFTTLPNVNRTLPSCDLPSIPPGYCRCNVSIQINNNTDSSVSELIQNLTVNKDETSKSRRKLTSADDSRVSAKAVGAVGLAVLLAVSITLFALDFTLIVHQTMMGIKLLKSVLGIASEKQVKND